MDLWDYSIWSGFLQIAIILVAILMGNILRRKIKFIRNSLLPSSVIAGIIIFSLKFIPFVGDFINAKFMEMLTYHCLGLGFIALTLKSGVKTKDKNKLVVLDTGILTVNGYLIQAIVGLVVSLFVFGGLFHAAGLLLPMGYGQGTGQALNVGKIFQTFGFENGASFGLAIAAIGFLVACLAGVVYLNYLKRKNRLVVQEKRIAENKLDNNIYASDEAPLNESVDKLTVQVSLVFGVYMITYLIILGLSYLAVEYLGKFGVNTLRPLLWGFNFLIGTLIAILSKKFMNYLRAKKIMNHTYVNNFMMNRLSGMFFDVMIVAGIAAIDWKNLEGLLWPLLVMCTLGLIGTFFYLKFVCHKLYPNYEHEAFFSMFGMLTGTASTGMILLREIDPNFETPAADNLVLQQVPAIAFGAPLLLLVSFAAESYSNSIIMLGIVCLMFAVYNVIILRKYIFRRKKKDNNE